MKRKRKLFCELGPVCYRISVMKCRLLRSFRNICGKEQFAAKRSEILLPTIAKSHFSFMLRRLNGVDMKLQENKTVNLKLASERISGIIINPGETFSFWKLVGATTKKKGYKEGLVIRADGALSSAVGGGLCQLANMIHWLVLNSPLTVTELHHHTDAIFPDERRRVPFGTGTSVFYNYLDYRFKNTTDQKVQLVLWTEGENLNGELRSERAFRYRYKLVEEDHHFKEEDGIFYRNSKVYRLIYEKETGNEIGKELILDNHSRVLYDDKLIPKEQIRQE